MAEQNIGKTTFARRTQNLMKEQRYSQAKLCELCGITQAAFSRYMTTERIPRADILANIANILHTTSDYLLGQDSSYEFPQIKTLLANSKDNLTVNQRKELADLLLDINLRLGV